MIKSVPTGRAEFVKLAEPPFSVPVLNTVVPFSNVTVSPSGGTPAPETNYRAVKGHRLSDTTGLRDDVSVLAA